MTVVVECVFLLTLVSVTVVQCTAWGVAQARNEYGISEECSKRILFYYRGLPFIQKLQSMQANLPFQNVHILFLHSD